MLFHGITLSLKKFKRILKTKGLAWWRIFKKKHNHIETQQWSTILFFSERALIIFKCINILIEALCATWHEVVRLRWGEISPLEEKISSKRFLLLNNTLAIEDVKWIYNTVSIFIWTSQRLQPYFGVFVIITVNARLNNLSTQISPSSPINAWEIHGNRDVQTRPSYMISFCHILLARVLVNASRNSGNVSYAWWAVLLTHPRLKPGLRYVVHRWHLHLLHISR